MDPAGPGLSAAAVVGSSALGWLLWSLLVGYGGHRLPAAWLRTFTALDPPAGGDRLARLGIRRWKDHLPEAGAFFPGGRAKRLPNRDASADPEGDLAEDLERLLVETRRAELVHLAIWPFALATALWLPAPAVLVNLAFATAFNLPCLLVQRFNRGRLLRLLGCLEERVSRRSGDRLRAAAADGPPGGARRRSP